MSDLNTSSLDALDSIDDLLDKNLDDIADLPEFKPFAPGAHKALLKWAIKDIEKGNPKVKVKHVEATFVCIETMELVNGDDAPSKAGDKCSTAYDLTNENAMGALKKAVTSL